MSKTMTALKSAHLTTPPSVAELGQLSTKLTSAVGADARALRGQTVRAIKANPGKAAGVFLGAGVAIGALGMLLARTRKT